MSVWKNRNSCKYSNTSDVRLLALLVCTTLKMKDSAAFSLIQTCENLIWSHIIGILCRDETREPLWRWRLVFLEGPDMPLGSVEALKGNYVVLEKQIGNLAGDCWSLTYLWTQSHLVQRSWQRNVGIHVFHFIQVHLITACAELYDLYLFVQTFCSFLNASYHGKHYQTRRRWHA